MSLNLFIYFFFVFHYIFTTLKKVSNEACRPNEICISHHTPILLNDDPFKEKLINMLLLFVNEMSFYGFGGIFHF